MKRICCLFALSFSLLLHAQNLVPNPSFEDTVACPTSVDEVYNCVGWSSFGNTSDYFNMCNTGVVGVPNNFFGFQYAHNGAAYCGLYNYEPTVGYREYIGSLLTDSLQIGIKYFVSFYTNLSNTRRCKSNKIGVRFSTIPYSSTQLPPLNNWSHLFSQNLITDTANWSFITGSFIADSNYKYIIVGNFYDNLNTDTLDCGPSSGSIAYLYIDDVCVSVDSAVCNDVKMGSFIKTIENQFRMFPNPSSEKIYLENDASFVIEEIKIYDAKLNAIKIDLEKVSERKYLVSLFRPARGVYFIYVLYNNDKYFRNKIIINY